MSGQADAAVRESSNKAASPHDKPAPRRSRAAVVLIPLLLLGAAVAIVITFFTQWSTWVGGRVNQWTDDAFLQANVTPISARVSGYVRRVAVNDYQRVTAGQLLYEIVDDDYRAQVDQAQSNLAAAKAAITTTQTQRDLQQSNIKQAQAQLDRDRSQLDNDRTDLRRYNDLAPVGAITKQTADTQRAKVNQDLAVIADDSARVEAQQKQLVVYDAQMRQQGTDVSAREAALDLAQITLGYTRITAPADGVVGQRQAQPGQYVNVGTQVITLAPLPDVWVIANYKETQLTRVRVGQSATVHVDTFPGTALRGRVQTISPASGAQFALLPPDNATGNFTKVVQRIAVKITIDRPNPLETLLRPGMSVEATIHTDDPPPDSPAR